jgi:uncharacterized GH25 family protein
MKMAWRTRICGWVFVAASVFLLLTPLAGHDFWLASSDWAANPGSTIALTANVGDNTFPVSESFTNPDRVEYVRLLGPESQELKPEFRKAGESLATSITLPSTPATYAIVMSVKGHFLSMPADKFGEYLREEGLHGVLAQRVRLKETDRPSRERYWRQAKILVHAGDGVGGHITKPTTLVAELVPNSDFTRAHPGDTVSVQLLYLGKPVREAQIAFTASHGAPKQPRVTRGRTDRDGRMQFKLVGEGPYLLSTVVMVRREGETGREAADWESYWCSLTFDISSGVKTGTKSPPSGN